MRFAENGVGPTAVRWGVPALAFLVALALVFLVPHGPVGPSTLTVLHRGMVRITALELYTAAGARRALNVPSPGDSMRYFLRGLPEGTWRARVTRANGRVTEAALGPVVGGLGIDDTLWISDSTASIRRWSRRPEDDLD